MSSFSGNKLIARNTVFLSIRLVFVLVVSLYTSRVTLHVLGVEDFGIYNVVGGFVAMFSFMNASLINGAQRFYNFELGQKGALGITRVYNASIRIQLILAGIVIILCETIGLWYLYNKMVVPSNRFSAAFWVFQASVVTICLAIVNVPFSTAIIAHERLDYYAIVNICDTVLKLGIVLSLPYIPGDKLVDYAFLVIGISFVNCLLYFVYAKRKFPELRLEKTVEKGLYTKMLSFSGWNLLGTFTRMSMDQGLNLILNLFFGPIVNAARGIAFQVRSAVVGFVSNVNMAARPQLTQAFAMGNRLRTINLMFSMSKVCFFILFLFAVPISLEVDYLLHLWLGDSVAEMTNVFIVLVIASTIINNVNAPVAMVVHATGKLAKYQIITSIIGLLILPVSYYALKRGAPAYIVFIFSILFEGINSLITLFLLKEIYPFSIREYTKAVYFPCALLLTAVIPAYLVKCAIPSSFFRLVCITAVSTLTICVMGYWICLNEKEKRFVRSMVLKIKMKIFHNEETV